MNGLSHKQARRYLQADLDGLLSDAQRRDLLMELLALRSGIRRPAPRCPGKARPVLLVLEPAPTVGWMMRSL